MIVIGYPGIGKTTCSKNNKSFIDLDSSSFNVDGKKPKDWQYAYCQTAEHLSEQGYVVFISSHKEVRNYFKNKDLDMNNYENQVVVIYPDISLKNEWIKRLEDRYNKSESDKDLRALNHAKNHFEDDIKDIEKDFEENKKLWHLSLDEILYDLESVIDWVGI